MIQRQPLQGRLGNDAPGPLRGGGWNFAIHIVKLLSINLSLFNPHCQICQPYGGWKKQVLADGYQ
jgi:hypothetical protein